MRIKELLKEKGLTQQDLAEKVGVSYQSMKQTLNASSVTTSTLEKIAIALDVPMWQLFTSYEEIIKQNNKSSSFHCPNCGAQLEIKIQKTN